MADPRNLVEIKPIKNILPKKEFLKLNPFFVRDATIDNDRELVTYLDYYYPTLEMLERAKLGTKKRKRRRKLKRLKRKVKRLNGRVIINIKNNNNENSNN